MTWTQKTISELGRVVTGKTPDTSNADYFAGEFPFVTPSDIDYSNYYCQRTERFVSEAAREKHKNQFLPKDSVMFTCIGNTIGKCAITSTDSLTNQQINSVVANEQNDAKFIYYCLTNSVQSIRQLGGGAATPIINKTAFESISFRVPAGDIQRRIADILSTYDDLIENNCRRMALLEESARLLYREWFVRLRFPGYEHTPIVDGVPQGWQSKTLGDLCSDIRDMVLPEALEPDTPYIGLEHIPRRSISLNEWGTAAEVTSSKSRFKAGEIIFGKIRPYFHKVGIAFVDGVASSDAIVVRPADDTLHSLVLMTMSSDEFVAVTAQQMKEGSKMPRADWKQMKAYSVPLPPSGLLSNFDSVIQPIVEQLKTLSFTNQKLRTARDLLLPRLMSGELAV
ncbi:restriction endonuclease subunit S [Comamonas testosteroni]|uniref:restriction endonuclease subunit S n=1 Tax=Comamonas testosteroni TaxID=285 RepID=UPI0009BA842B|nr:restriction endonuclease subunit S [Comamonas testosteroni]